MNLKNTKNYFRKLSFLCNSKILFGLFVFILLFVVKTSLVFASANLPSGFYESLVTKDMPQSPSVLKALPDGRLFLAEQAGKTWSFTTSAIAANNSVFVSQSVPATMQRGQQYNVSITMKNTGTKTWTVAEAYKIGTWLPRDNFNWGFNRVRVPASVAPNTNATFTFTVTAPTTAGTYDFQWRMIQELIMWFGQSTSNVRVVVQ